VFVQDKITSSRKSLSPELNPHPITHLKNHNETYDQGRSSRKRIFSSKRAGNRDNSPLPVENYDPIFDHPAHPNDEYNASDIDEDIEANTPYSHKAMPQPSSSSNSKPTRTKAVYNEDPLECFAIPLQHIKQKAEG
jgi:hypothetical protein